MTVDAGLRHKPEARIVDARTASSSDRLRKAEGNGRLAYVTRLTADVCALENNGSRSHKAHPIAGFRDGNLYHPGVS